MGGDVVLVVCVCGDFFGCVVGVGVVQVVQQEGIQYVDGVGVDVYWFEGVEVY